MLWAQNAKDILIPCLILNRSPCLLSGYSYRECIITVFFGLCSSRLPLNALVILRWILWFIMFWILIIVFIISVQTCKLVQAINLMFKRNNTQSRRYWCISSGILTGNGNIAPCADSPQVLLLIGIGSIIPGRKKEMENKKLSRFSLCSHVHQNKPWRNSL